MQENAQNFLLDRITALEQQLIEARRPALGAVLQVQNGHYIPLPILRLNRNMNGTYDVIVGGV